MGKRAQGRGEKDGETQHERRLLQTSTCNQILDLTTHNNFNIEEARGPEESKEGNDKKRPVSEGKMWVCRGEEKPEPDGGT